jgi:hypothetical protein
MARKPNARLLDSGDTFPALDITLTDGNRLRLPADLTRPYDAVLLNRGPGARSVWRSSRRFNPGSRSFMRRTSVS